MKYIIRYNESQLTKATDETIKEIISDEINKLGKGADLNHIDVSKVTCLKDLFFYSDFCGDVSKWNVKNVENLNNCFYGSKFGGNLSSWNVENVTNFWCCLLYSKFDSELDKWEFKNMRAYKSFIDSHRDRSHYKDDFGDLLWYFKCLFKDDMSLKESKLTWNWLDSKKRIIWKRRLEKALKEFGSDDYYSGSLKIPTNVWKWEVL